METLNLTNITIKEKQDINHQTYYLIVDNNTDNAYFCFSGSMKKGWDSLVSNWEQIKEVELEFETSARGNYKVVSLHTGQENTIFV